MLRGGKLAAMEKTTVYLRSHLQRALREVARLEKRTQDEVFRKALEEYLKRRERPRLRSGGIGEDAELSGAETEDWLRHEWGES
jgi:hypothetical protein